jgi:hypothetical protein
MPEPYGTTTLPEEELGGLEEPRAQGGFDRGEAPGALDDGTSYTSSRPGNFAGSPAEVDYMADAGRDAFRRMGHEFGRVMRERPIALALGAAVLGLMAGRWLRR